MITAALQSPALSDVTAIPGCFPGGRGEDYEFLEMIIGIAGKFAFRSSEMIS